MLFTADMKDLLRLFDEHEVEYVLVGGFAVNYYGYVRTTQDIDLLVFPAPENARRIKTALPTSDSDRQAFQTVYSNRKEARFISALSPTESTF